MLVVGCVTPIIEEEVRQLEEQPPNIENICAIFTAKPHWVEGARASYGEWNLPVEVMMAIMRYESSFIATARPLDAKGRRRSSAYGYSQALDGTWKQYKQETGRHKDKRDDFTAAVYFIGWYADKALDVHEELSPYDVTGLYVLYHDGWSSLKDERRELKIHVLETAAKVHKQTLSYHQQLKECPQIRAELYTQSANEGDIRWF